jgi:hypothetical protein
MIFGLYLLFLGSLPIPLIATGWTAEMVGELVTSRFPERDQDVSLYTVRYVSQNDSEDSAACLENQLYRNSSDVSYCRTLRYSLSSNHSSGDAPYIVNSYLILLVSPGRHPYSSGSNVSLDIMQSRNIVIAKNSLVVKPGVSEAELHCIVPNPVHFNNMYMADVQNVAMIGLTFTSCGQRSNALTIMDGENIIVENCTVR